MSEEKEVNASQQSVTDTQHETSESSEAVIEQKPEHHPVKQSSGSTASFLATLIALAAVGGTFYLWQQQKVMRNDLTSLDSNISRLLEVVEQRDIQQRDRIESLALHQHQDTEQKLARLESLVLELRGRLSQERQDWILAEVEYLLRVADHRLVLEKDPQTAIAALHQAEQKLTRIQHPSLQAVRQEIKHEIDALNAISLPDAAMISAELAKLSAQLTQWPFASDASTNIPVSPGENPAPEANKEEGGLTRMLNRVWEDLKGLVTIRRSDEVSRPLMDTEQRYFLQQNLRFKFESARLALLSGHDQAYHDSLDEAKSWLQRYYDTSSPAVRGALATLERLNNIVLTPRIPSLEQGLHLLQQAIMAIQSEQAAKEIPGLDVLPQDKAGATSEEGIAPQPQMDGATTLPSPSPVSPGTQSPSTEVAPTVEVPEPAQTDTPPATTDETPPQGALPPAVAPGMKPEEHSPDSATPAPAPSDGQPSDVPSPPPGIAL